MMDTCTICGAELRQSEERCPRCPDPRGPMPDGYRYDEFGHLLTRRSVSPVGPHWQHVHEDQALACTWFEHHGWPRNNA